MNKFGCLLLATFTGVAQANYTVVLPADIDGDSEPLVQDVAACRKEVDEVIVWGDEENQKQAQQLSDLRKEHAQAKQDFVLKLQHIIDVTQDWTNHEMNVAYENSVKNAVKTAYDCIQSNEGMYYPHNIALLVVPEQTRIECYRWALTLPGLGDPQN